MTTETKPRGLLKTISFTITTILNVIVRVASGLDNIARMGEIASDAGAKKTQRWADLSEYEDMGEFQRRKHEIDEELKELGINLEEIDAPTSNNKFEQKVQRKKSNIKLDIE